MGGGLIGNSSSEVNGSPAPVNSYQGDSSTIHILKVLKLDENKEAIEDITDKVKNKDNVWANIQSNQYVRIVFEQPLSNTNDITIFARTTNWQEGQPGSKIKAYTENGTAPLAEFPEIKQGRSQQVLLTNLKQPTDTFDLKVVSPSLSLGAISTAVEIDWIVDPTGPGIALGAGVKISTGVQVAAPSGGGSSIYTGYSSSSDGYVYYQGAQYGAYSVTHDNVSGTVVSNGDIFCGQLTGNRFRIYRGFLFFDTSTIPSNATITSATLSLYGKADISSTDFDVTIQNGQPTYPHDALAAGDYLYSQYSGNGGTFDTAGFSSSGYNDITLSTTGLTWIQTGAGAETKLALLSSRDISATAPSGDEYVYFWSNEKGAGYQPKLVVNYTTP